MNGERWTNEQIVIMEKYYGNIKNRVIAAMIGRTETACQVKAKKLGLHKSKEFRINVTSMENNGNWKGGNRLRERQGYRYLATGNKLQAEHRVIIEAVLGRKLSSNEVVHHKNGNPSDNRIENLAVLLKGEHFRLHKTGKKASLETRNKMRLYAKNRTEDHNRKISEGLRGHVPWNKKNIII